MFHAVKWGTSFKYQTNVQPHEKNINIAEYLFHKKIKWFFYKNNWGKITTSVTSVISKGEILKFSVKNLKRI